LITHLKKPHKQVALKWPNQSFPPQIKFQQTLLESNKTLKRVKPGKQHKETHSDPGCVTKF